MIAAKKGAEGDCCNIGTIPPSKGSIAYFRNGRHYGQSARVPVKRGSNVLKGMARPGRVRAEGGEGVVVDQQTRATIFKKGMCHGRKCRQEESQQAAGPDALRSYAGQSAGGYLASVPLLHHL